MTVRTLIQTFEKSLRDNSPVILTALGISGTVTTAYLAARASFEASDVIRITEEYEGTPSDKKERVKKRTQLVWKFYIPAGISGVATIVCIVGATKVSSRRTAAVAAAYSLSEKAFSEYREKVVEKFGEGKDRAVRDEIAQDRLNKNPPPSQSVLVTGPGNVLCCEMFTMRYFTSDMETLRKAQNEINAKLLRSNYVTLDDFYYIIHLAQTSYSGEIGWEPDKLMELEFSTVLTDDGRPCLSFDYNYTKHI